MRCTNIVSIFAAYYRLQYRATFTTFARASFSGQTMKKAFFKHCFLPDINKTENHLTSFVSTAFDIIHYLIRGSYSRQTAVESIAQTIAMHDFSKTFENLSVHRMGNAIYSPRVLLPALCPGDVPQANVSPEESFRKKL